MLTITRNEVLSNENGYRYLETDGNGGFISQMITGANTRNDDSLFMVSLAAPIKRYKLVQKFDELLIVDGIEYNLSSQTYINQKQNTNSDNYILKFEYQLYPQITYQVADVTIIKSLVYANSSNQVAVTYQVTNPFERKLKLVIRPQLAGHPLGHYKPKSSYDYQVATDSDVVAFTSQSEHNLYIKSAVKFIATEPKFIGDYDYAHDRRDGRDAIGSSCSYGNYQHISQNQNFQIDFILSQVNKFKDSTSVLFESELKRKSMLINNSVAKSEFTQSLALATDNYLVNRLSTKHQTIIAGYPFFSDWGRDTFWALNGICLQTKQYDAAKGILRSFAKYENRGLIPNMFPEASEEPLYNSVDAPLLFINSCYEYFLETADQDLIIELKPQIESIINNYIKGTDYHIKMDDDGLISSGANLEQLTWMDVRYDTILPTPRQGKCVEINSMWYNALEIVIRLEAMLDQKFMIATNLEALSALVRTSFRQAFKLDNGYLKDVISNTDADCQIRSNAIWAVAQNFSPLELEEMKSIVKIAGKNLYTSLGIRTLAPDDQQFKPIYGGSQYERDMAYHQGTVWPFILGGYIRAYLKSEEYSKQSKLVAKQMLEGSRLALNEYCIGQICEVHDGLNPNYSKGCYAQAWSIAEIYRAANEVEE